MNSDRAFEQHTDLARALNRPGSPERAWWDANADRRAARHADTAFRGFAAFADFDRVLSSTTGEGLQTDVVTEFIPGEAYAALAHRAGDTDLIGVVDPDDFDPNTTTAPAEARDAPDQIAIPVTVLAEMAAWQITNSPTVYVTKDMVAMLEHAAHGLDDTDIMPRHPAYPFGFAVLARPIRVPYGDGTDQIIHAFAWTDFGAALTSFGTVGHPGLLYEFADRRAADREVAHAAQAYPSRTAWSNAPDLVLTVADPFMTGTPVGGPVETVEHVTSRAAAMAAKIRDETIAVRYLERNTPAGPHAKVIGRAQPYLAALLLLLGQEITVTRTEPANQFAARRAAKTGSARGHVTVVDVRRRVHRTGEPGEPAGPAGERLHERHIVGGHWKWQPYGKERRLRKRIFVAAYVRGPEDAPLVAKPRVHRL